MHFLQIYYRRRNLTSKWWLFWIVVLLVCQGGKLSTRTCKWCWVKTNKKWWENSQQRDQIWCDLLNLDILSDCESTRGFHTFSFLCCSVMNIVSSFRSYSFHFLKQVLIRQRENSSKQTKASRYQNTSFDNIK